MKALATVLVALSFDLVSNICHAFNAMPINAERHDSSAIFHLAKSYAASDTTTRPLLVVIPGFSQSLELYMPHMATFSRQRDVLLFQPIGGRKSPSSQEPITDVSLPAQVRALSIVLDEVCGKSRQIDIVGFSMGGRIALAAACILQHRVHKLHLTGVGLQPSLQAEIQRHAWKELLQQGNIHGFAWSVLLVSYHESFLLKNQHRLAAWVENLSQSNAPLGLLALLEQTREPEWSVEKMAHRLPHNCEVHLLVGEHDQMVTEQSALALHDRLPRKGSFTIFRDHGHAIPMESPREWRNLVLECLADPSQVESAA